MISCKYTGAEPWTCLNTIVNSLNLIRDFMGSQWSSCRIGDIGSNFLLQYIILPGCFAVEHYVLFNTFYVTNTNYVISNFHLRKTFALATIAPSMIISPDNMPTSGNHQTGILWWHCSLKLYLVPQKTVDFIIKTIRVWGLLKKSIFARKRSAPWNEREVLWPAAI